MKVSKSFEAFAKEVPKVQRAWMKFVRTLDQASALDKKTEELAYIAVLAAVRLAGGLLFHVKMAKSLGAIREEIISDVLVGFGGAACNREYRGASAAYCVGCV